MHKAKCILKNRNITIRLNKLEYGLITQQANKLNMNKKWYIKMLFEKAINEQYINRVDRRNKLHLMSHLEEEKMKFLIFTFMFVKYLSKQYLSENLYQESFKSAEDYIRELSIEIR